MTVHLDIAPLITALRRRPAEFAWAGEWLRHVPSDHGFRFDADGRVAIRADCACAFMSVSRVQGGELYDEAERFTRDYWRPKVVNRHFASHFETPSPLVRLWRWINRHDRHDHRLELGMELPEDRNPPAEVIELPLVRAAATEKIAA